jgi:hypothetical protein
VEMCRADELSVLEISDNVRRQYGLRYQVAKKIIFPPMRVFFKMTSGVWKECLQLRIYASVASFETPQVLRRKSSTW